MECLMRAYVTLLRLSADDRRGTVDSRNIRHAATAFAALIDHKTGDLNWAFVVDPFVQAVQVCEPDNTRIYSNNDTLRRTPTAIRTRMLIFTPTVKSS